MSRTHGSACVLTARSVALLLAIPIVAAPVLPRVKGFGIFNATGLEGGDRWNAVVLSVSGQDRSLAGGLSYLLQGGSYQSYMNRFTRNAPVTVQQFTDAVTWAFTQWTVEQPYGGAEILLLPLPIMRETAPELLATFAGRKSNRKCRL